MNQQHILTVECMGKCKLYWRDTKKRRLVKSDQHDMLDSSSHIFSCWTCHPRHIFYTRGIPRKITIENFAFDKHLWKTANREATYVLDNISFDKSSQCSSRVLDGTYRSHVCNSRCLPTRNVRIELFGREEHLLERSAVSKGRNLLFSNSHTHSFPHSQNKLWHLPLTCPWQGSRSILINRLKNLPEAPEMTYSLLKKHPSLQSFHTLLWQNLDLFSIDSRLFEMQCYPRVLLELLPTACSRGRTTANSFVSALQIGIFGSLEPSCWLKITSWSSCPFS